MSVLLDEPGVVGTNSGKVRKVNKNLIPGKNNTTFSGAPGPRTWDVR